jgi:hypothetical protein
MRKQDFHPAPMGIGTIHECFDHMAASTRGFWQGRKRGFSEGQVLREPCCDSKAMDQRHGLVFPAMSTRTPLSVGHPPGQDHAIESALANSVDV